MKLIPKRNQVVGHVVDIVSTNGGLVMPDTQMKGVTIFVKIESVGPDVKDYKPGDLVLPHHVNHVFMRGGSFHRVIFEDREILGILEDISVEQMTIDGKPMSQVVVEPQSEARS